MCVRFMSGSRESLASAGGKFRCQSGWGRPEAESQYVRCRAVGEVHSTLETVEQRLWNHEQCGYGLAETVEGRDLTEGNLFGSGKTCTQCQGGCGEF